MPYKDIKNKRKYQNSWMAKRRKKWISDNGPCNKCGSRNQLEIHHYDPKQKINHRVWSWSEKRRLAELEKCVVLCNSCHTKITSAQNSVEITHGTHVGYAWHNCRCDKCREAHKLYMRQYKSRRGIK